MTSNWSVPADDLISKLKIAASDDKDFYGMVNVQWSIVLVSNPRGTSNYDDIYAVYESGSGERYWAIGQPRVLYYAFCQRRAFSSLLELYFSFQRS